MLLDSAMTFLSQSSRLMTSKEMSVYVLGYSRTLVAAKSSRSGREQSSRLRGASARGAVRMRTHTYPGGAPQVGDMRMCTHPIPKERTWWAICTCGLIPSPEERTRWAISACVLIPIPEECTRFRGKGYQEGFIEGGQLGEAEGRRYGLANGAKIGSEVSFYKGFVVTWKCLLQNNQDAKNSKKEKALNSILEMVHNFPYEDPTNEKLQEDLEKMRAKFKQICSLLNVKPTFHTEKSVGMSF